LFESDALAAGIDAAALLHCLPPNYLSRFRLIVVLLPEPRLLLPEWWISYLGDTEFVSGTESAVSLVAMVSIALRGLNMW